MEPADKRQCSLLLFVATSHSDLWQELIALCTIHEVEFVWLPMDPSVKEYQRCDELAREVTARLVREMIDGCAKQTGGEDRASPA